jgi:hypothetical protein
VTKTDGNEGDDEMTTQAATALRRESLSTSRLASRLGMQPAHVESRRRAGELLGVRPPGTWEYLYPAWQFNGGGKALPIVQELLREARRARMHDAELYDVLTRRAGLVGGERLVDHMRAGRDWYVLQAVKAAGREPQ